MIEIVSIHVPKTGGRSFRQMLEEIYGPDGHFHLTRYTGRVWNETLRKKIPSTIRAVHGHMKYRDVEGMVLETGARVITWLREPVERLISNFYFLKQRIMSGERPWAAHRVNETLMQYCRMSCNRNRMAAFVEGRPLRDYFFVGILEHYSEDLDQLRAQLGWPDIREVHANNNSSFKSKFPPVEESVRHEIRKLNAIDIALYEEALRLRRLRRPSQTAVK